MKQAKIFILDTNILLHDYRSIFQFQENDLVIPISVLEELDNFKKGHDQINYNARNIIRELDSLLTNENSRQGNGISLGNGIGRLYIEYPKPFSETMQKFFFNDVPDHRILAVAAFYTEKYKDRYVSLVSKDINLRMKARSIGVNSEDYKTDAIEDLGHIHRETDVIENVSESVIDAIYKSHEPLSIKDLKINPPQENYFILKSLNSTVLVYLDRATYKIRQVPKQKCFGITARNAEQSFALHALCNENLNLVAMTGKAGTGKTLLALAAALEQKRNYDQILIARPIVPLSDKDLGYLPGNVKEKVAPYMQPLFDNLDFIKKQFSAQSPQFRAIEDMLIREELVITPLAYIRGRSLSNAYFIVDEAQNLTPHEVKTIITRAGECTKIVFTGDIHQIDSPYLDEHSNGLVYLSERMKGQDLFEHLNLVHGERSRLSELASNLL